MWPLLVPLIHLFIVLLVGVRNIEKFTTSTTSTTGTTRDASGNTVDASGNVIPTSAATISTISLSLADLMALFRAAFLEGSTAATTTAATTSGAAAATAATPSTTSTTDTTTPSEFYNQFSPQLLDDITKITKTSITGSPYEHSTPTGCDASFSDSMAQGVELQNVLRDYVKRDEIPCYGCTL